MSSPTIETNACTHPQEKRWQRVDTWQCACGRYFWGNKKDTPEVDCYGTPTIRRVIEGAKNG